MHLGALAVTIAGESPILKGIAVSFPIKNFLVEGISSIWIELQVCAISSIAPNYSGTVYGLRNFAAQITGFCLKLLYSHSKRPTHT